MFSVGVNTALCILYHEGHANRKKPKWPTTVLWKSYPGHAGDFTLTENTVDSFALEDKQSNQPMA